MAEEIATAQAEFRTTLVMQHRPRATRPTARVQPLAMVLKQATAPSGEFSPDQARTLAPRTRSLRSRRLATVDLLQSQKRPTRLRRPRVKPLVNHEAGIADVEVVVVVAAVAR